MASIRNLFAMSAFTLGLMFAVGEAYARQTKACSPKDAQAADAVVDQLDSWSKLDRAFRKYGHCDDGSIAEGNSEAIARLLIDHWDTLPSLAKLVKRDPELKKFVLRHIDTTLDTNDLDKINGLASSKCPEGVAFLCKDLRAATVRALK